MDDALHKIPIAMLEASARHHVRLCPRQVLGVRIGMLAGKLLELDLPRADKRLVAIVETDGCMVDGLTAATGCSVGRRTLFVKDFGKVAAALIDTDTDRTVRIAPRAGCRDRAQDYAPGAEDSWHAQLLGYQVMPDDRLLAAQWVDLTVSLHELISEPGFCAICDECGEEIMNQREVVTGGRTLCRGCAGDTYYSAV